MKKPALSSSPSRDGKRFLAPLLAGTVLALYVAAVYVGFPRELSALAQRSLGLGFAALAVLTFWAATRRREPTAAVILRARLAQHSDFGKQLHGIPVRRQRTIRLPWLGPTSLRTLGGVVVFALAIAGWLIWAPIRVKGADDMTDPMSAALSEEIVAALLVLPDGHTAVLQMPMLPPRAQALAKLIPDAAGPYQLALREFARGHFDEAQELLNSARQAPAADTARIDLAEAQISMYSCRFAEAVPLYAHLLQQKPEDPMLLCQLAVAQMQAGQFAPAAALVEQAAKLCRDSAAESPQAAACLHLQALVALNRGTNLDQAEIIAHDSGALWKKILGEEHPSVAASRNNLAALYVLRGDYAGGEECFQEAQDIWSRAAAIPDPHVATGRQNLAMLYHVRGAENDAQQSLDQATKIYREELPKDHPIFIVALSAEAVLQRAGGHYAEAQAKAKKALEQAEKSLGGEHPYVAVVLDTLMAASADQAQYAEACKDGYRASNLIKKLWGPAHPYLAMTLSELALVLTAQGHYAEAETCCTEALRIVQAALGPTHPWVAVVQYARGRLEIARDAPRDARGYLEQARKIWSAALGEEHPRWIGVLGDLASLDNSPRALAGGVAHAKRAVELAEQHYGGDHPELARLLCILAALDRQQANDADADACVARALAIREKTLVPSHPDLAVTLELYATVLEAMDPPQNDRAEQMRSRAKAIRAKHAEEDQAK
jgi:tetratricopeptide (TPR) repeat protein